MATVNKDFVVKNGIQSAERILVGNTTVFANLTANGISQGNSTSNSSLSSTTLAIGNSTVNTSISSAAVTTGTVSATLLSIGNTTVNAVANSTTLKIQSISANGSIGTAGQALFSDGTQSYWAALPSTSLSNNQIRDAVEAADDSNTFTDADHTKLNGIESGATADQTASEILTAIKTVDGSGSGLDADLLDGINSLSFTRLDSGTTAEIYSTYYRMHDNKYFYFGSAPGYSLTYSGTHMYHHMYAGNTYLTDNGTTRFTFERTTGSFTAVGNITAYSDRRLKDDIEIIDDALEIISQINGVRYTRDGIAGVGVIAQDVDRACPELVHHNDDGYLSVAYGNMAGLFVEAIKKQQTQINQLTEIVNQLKTKMEGK